MKTLLLAVILAAPLHAADTTGPAGPRSSGAPVIGTGVTVPALPNLAPGLGTTSALPNTGLPQTVTVPGATVLGATAPGAAGVSAQPQSKLSGPEAAGPQGAPEAGKAAAAANEESAAKKAAPEAAAAPKTEAAGEPSKKDSEQAASNGQVSDETAKSNADAKFDGQGKQNESAPAVSASKTLGGRILARIGLSRFTGRKEERPKTAFDRDNYGGPQNIQLTKKGKLTYGLRWGLSMTGIATLLQFGLGMLFSFFPWQLHVGTGLLTGAGRVELMTGAGPHAIAQMIASHPLAFFFLQLPMSTMREEIVFRALQFGLTFLVLAAIKPVAAAVARFLDKVPDVVGLESVIKKGLAFVSKLSGRAFSIAAAMSAWSFTTAHFANWGIDPVTMAVHLSLGLSLAYVAYKTRSILTAFTAHMTYNVLSVAGVALALYLSPLAGIAFSLGLSVVSVAGLYLHWRSYRKARGLAVANARLAARNGLMAVLMAAMLGSGLVGMSPRSPQQQARYDTAATWTIPAQQAQPKQDPQQIPPEIMEALKQALGKDSVEIAPKKLEGLAAVTAQAKQSVVEVVNPGVGLGSGYVVSEDGLLLTNAHVAAGAQGGIVLIKFENGMQGKAKVVAFNADKDIAIIQLPQRKGGWPALKIAAGDSMSEGDEVLAMGHPLGLPFTVTRGIVSGVGADRGNLWVDHLQTDAAINHGNSGGPLINAKTGEVVGMDSEIASPTDANVGLGFAITAKDLQAAVDQFRATGNINSAWAGMIFDRSTQPNYPQGIEVEQVRPGSPAAKAGLQPGDVVLGANGQTFGEPAKALHQLALTIARTKPGGQIAVAVGRDGEVSVLNITLGDKQ